jgi:DNA-binding XRE family transcriptional regulator
MAKIITDSYLNSIINSDIYLEHTYLMKYLEYASRFKRLWKDSDAPKTQKELAKWLNYSQPMINYWLNGEKLPSMETAIKIADKFGVCVEWLITGKGLKHPNDEPELQNHINVTDLTDDQRALINQMMAQFTPKTLENNTNKTLTTSIENAGGGGGGTPPVPTTTENNTG